MTTESEGDGVMVAVVWTVRDQAERVLRERRTFRDRLQALPAPSCDVEAAVLIYGELVANTIRYANGAIEVRLEQCGGDRVLVVRDFGPGLHCAPTNPRRDLYAESGRGLAIVEMLAREVAVEAPEGGGTLVRAVLPEACTAA